MQTLVCLCCEYFFQGPSSIISGHKLSDIFLNDIIELSFEIQINSICSSDYCELLQIGDGAIGLPLISIERETSALTVRCSNNSNVADQYIVNQAALTSTVIDGNYNKMYFKFSSQQRIFIYNDIFTLKNQLNGNYNSSIYLHKQHPLYINFPGNTAINANIRNICITSTDIHALTFDSTNNPTTDPTTDRMVKQNDVDIIDENTSNADYIVSDDNIISIVGMIIFISIMLAILDIIHSKMENGLLLFHNNSDQYNFIMIIIIALKVCDIITDIAILFKMCTVYIHIENILYLVLLSMSSFIISYLITFYSMYKILRFQSTTKGPMIWFNNNKYMFFFTILISITCDSYSSLCLISSNIFGINLFDSGHSIIELNKFKPIKILTIIFQNIFEIIIQLLLLMMIKKISILIIVSLIISFIISIPILICFCFNYINNRLYKWYEYDIMVRLIPSHNKCIDIDGNKNEMICLIKRYSKNKYILKQRLSYLLGIRACKLDIGYIEFDDIDNNGDKFKIHILYEMATKTYDEMSCTEMINALYDNKYDILSEEIQKIYHISSDWSVICLLSIDLNSPSVTSVTSTNGKGNNEHVAVPSFSNLDTNIRHSPFALKPDIINNTQLIEEIIPSQNPELNDIYTITMSDDMFGKYDDEKITKTTIYDTITSDNGIIHGKHRKIYSEGPKRLFYQQKEEEKIPQQTPEIIGNEVSIYSEGPKIINNNNNNNNNDELMPVIHEHRDTIIYTPGTTNNIGDV